MNQGIMHAAFKTGGQPLCRSRRAHMSVCVEQFRTDQKQCKRCAASLAKMDAKRARKQEAGQ